jgi:4-hydroxybenzoate polyprenyltransferase
MNSLALILILSAAFVHAFWNLLAKRAACAAIVIFGERPGLLAMMGGPAGDFQSVLPLGRNRAF